ncbi:MAG: hypothetical protein U1C51_05290 [Candidatus Izemoplasmatales bacterium]|nr:hypothetical protein [bacterium]MDZ4196649.1 hypothetical protein [Candidatus Izemoplasmatales bacterium]
MKKILLFGLILLSLLVLVGCTNNPLNKDTTTPSSESIPLNQNALLDSISNAIKEAFE